jgi:hypothetical protein
VCERDVNGYRVVRTDRRSPLRLGDSNFDIGQMSLRRLQKAIQENEISFPAQVPVFRKQSRADIQWKVVELYFVRNWPPAAIGQRYQMTSERVRQVISQWVRRGAVLGYLQDVYR